MTYSISYKLLKDCKSVKPLIDRFFFFFFYYHLLKDRRNSFENTHTYLLYTCVDDGNDIGKRIHTYAVSGTAKRWIANDFKVDHVIIYFN
jgi:hypothetical protein